MPAPIIASALTAIASSLAKRGLDLLSGFFRGAEKKVVEDISAFIKEKTGIDINDVADNKLSEDQWRTLKEFEFQYQNKLLEARQQQDANDLERDRLTVLDRQYARDFQAENNQSKDPVVRRFIYFYATGLTLLSFAFIFYASFFYDHKNGDENTINTVLGFLLGVTLSTIIQYFFGSSVGSKSKEASLNHIRTNKEEGVNQ